MVKFFVVWTIFGGGTKSWNSRSGRIVWSLKIQECCPLLCWYHAIILWYKKNMPFILSCFTLEKALKSLIGWKTLILLCQILWNHKKAQSLVIWENLVQQTCYFTSYIFGAHLIYTNINEHYMWLWTVLK